MALLKASNEITAKLGLNKNDFIILINQPDNYFGTLYDLPEGIRFLQVEDNMKVDAIHIFAKSQYELIHELFLSKPLLKDSGRIWIFYPNKTSRIRTDLDVNTVIRFGTDIYLQNIQVMDFDSYWTGVEFKLPLK